MAEIFISYSRKDSVLAEEVLTWLREQGFMDVFLAHDQESGIVAGDEWRRALHREMQEAEVLILIISDNWFGSNWCVGEHRAAQVLGKRIIPMVFGLSNPAHLTEISSDIFQRINVGTDHTEALERLRDGLVSAGLSHGNFSFDPQRPPFPGLLAFEEKDAAVFFGREADIVKAMDRIRVMQQFNRPKLLIVLGNSGVGKSSLLRAGIMPRLRRREAGRLRLLGPLALGADPFRELRRVIRMELPKGDAELAAGLTAEAVLADDADGLVARLTAALTDPAAGAGRPTVIVDQFEQVLLAGQSPREAFLGLLSKIFDSANAWLGIATIRADFFPLIQAESVFGGIEYELLTLDRISEHRLNDVIEKPAARVRCHIEPDLVDRLIKDTVTTTALPFLAFALRELYDTVPTGQPWGLRDYEVLGEPSGDANPIVACVRGRANEAVFGTTPESDFDGDLRRAFVPMMTDISDNDQPILRTARWADLPPRALPALRRLEAARICFSTVDHDNAPCVSIAHGSLYQAWPPLQRAFEAEKRRLAEWRQAERSAQAWEQRSFSSAWIDHRGLRLIQLSRLARSTDYKGRISQRLHDYIAACRRHALLVLSRRAALAAAVVGIIATFGHEYSMRARLLGAADQVVDSKPFLGGALAFAALPPPRSLFPVQAGRALALLARSKLAFARGLFAPGHGLESVAFSPEGHSLAAASDQGDVSVWSTDTAAVLRRIAVLPQRALQVVKYSPSGNTIATGGADGVLYLIETGSWQIRASNRVHTAAINDLAFDAAGANILTVSVDGTAVQWDAATLDLRAKLALPSSVSGRLNCVAYGRDGSIVIGGTDKTVWRWRNAADAEPKTVRTENATIHSCDLDRNAKRVVIGTDDGHLAIIDLDSSSVDEIVSVPAMAVRAGVFSPDGGTVASAWDDHALRLTRLTSSGAPDTMVVDFHREPVRAAAFDAAGTRVASASSDNNDTGDAVVWDVAALQKNVVPAADAVFASICSSAIASRLTLWRPDSANGNTFEPTPDCACAGRGLLSKAFWTSVTARLGWAKAASVCSYTGS